jgi:hypothetical protein
MKNKNDLLIINNNSKTIDNNSNCLLDNSKNKNSNINDYNYENNYFNKKLTLIPIITYTNAELCKSKIFEENLKKSGIYR